MIRLLTHNWGWKLLSLAMAMLLWFALVGEPELVTSTSAPVEFRNIPRDLDISFDVMDPVHLEVRGPSGKLNPAALSNVAVVLDLSGVNHPGERTFTIQQWNVTLPPGVILARAVPAQVRVHFELRQSKEVPVRIRIGSPPPEGYRVVKQTVQPERMRVIGPASRVSRIDAVHTDPVELGGVVGETTFKVHAYVTDSQVRFESTPDATVHVVIEKEGVSGTR